MTEAPQQCPKCGKALRKWTTRVGQGRRAMLYTHMDGTECRVERATEKLARRTRPPSGG